MKYLLKTKWYCLRLIVALLLAAWVAITPTAIALSTPETVIANSNNQANITLLDRFEVQPEDVEPFLKRWKQLNDYMKQQPGFIAAEIRQTPSGSKNWVLSEEWESLKAYKAATSTEKFHSLLEKFPAKASWFAPELFKSK